MKQPFLPQTFSAHALTLGSIVLIASIAVFTNVSTNSLSAQLTPSPPEDMPAELVEICREQIKTEYFEYTQELVDTFNAAKNTLLSQCSTVFNNEFSCTRLEENRSRAITILAGSTNKRNAWKEVLAEAKKLVELKEALIADHQVTRNALIDRWYRADCENLDFSLDLGDLTFDIPDWEAEEESCIPVTCSNGEQFDTCDANGNSIQFSEDPCTTTIECPDPTSCAAPPEGCYYEGASETVDANGCTIRLCGTLNCADESMPLVCEYNGIVLQEGQSAIATDECNVCTCTNGQVSCTQNTCERESESCTTDNNCNNGLVCVNGQCTDPVHTPTCSNNEFQCGTNCCNQSQTCQNGQCTTSEPPLNCSTGETECGNVCCSSSQSCQNGQCQEVTNQCVNNNQVCSQHSDCCGENICDERQNRCKSPKGNGVTCESSSECAGNSTCEPDGSGNPNYYGRCALNEGELCYFGDSCVGDNECIDGMCQPTGASEGESCSATVTCKEGGGLQCKNGVCQSIKSTTPISSSKPVSPPACNSIGNNTDQYRTNKLLAVDTNNSSSEVPYLGGTGVMNEASNVAYLFESPQMECISSGMSCSFSRRIYEAKPADMYGVGRQYVPFRQIGELPFAWHGVQAVWNNEASQAYLFGGIRPSNNSSVENHNYVKDIYTFAPNGTTQKLASLPLVSNGNTANNVVVGAFNPTNEKLYLIETGRYNTIDHSIPINNRGDTNGRSDNYTRMWIYDINSRQFDTVNPPFIGDFFGKVSITYDSAKDKLYVFNTNNDGGKVYEVDPSTYFFTPVATASSLIHHTSYDPKTKQILVLSGNNRDRSIRAFDTSAYRFMPTKFTDTLLEQTQLLPFNTSDQDYTSLLMPSNKAERKTGTHSNGNTYTYNGYAENTVEFISILNCEGISCNSQAEEEPVIRFYHNDGGGLNTFITPNRAVQIEDNYFALFANSTNDSMKKVTMYDTEKGAYGVFSSFPEETKNAVVATVGGTKTIFATNTYNTRLYSVSVSRNGSNPSDPTQLHFGNIRTVATLSGIAADAVAEFDAARNNIVFFSNTSGIHSFNIETETLKQHQTTLVQNKTINDIKVAYLPRNSNGINAFILTDGAQNSNGTTLASSIIKSFYASLMEQPEVDLNPTNTKYHFVHYTSDSDTYYLHSNVTFNAPWTTRFQKINQLLAYDRDVLFVGNNEVYQMNVGMRTFKKVYDSQETNFVLNDLVAVQNSTTFNPDLLYSFAGVRSNMGVKTPYSIHLNTCEQ